MDTLEISEQNNGRSLYAAAMPLGSRFGTRIIHSVQLTPVIDIYRVQQGEIWGWREAIRSHNAGLPSQTPEKGRFYHSGDWMILEGAGYSWPRIFYRVGSEALGRNQIIIPNKRGDLVDLWRGHSGKRLIIESGKFPLYRLSVRNFLQ